MGYNIAICETECAKAPCREKKLHVVKILLDDKYPELQTCDEIVSLDDAKKAVGDMDSFFTRNRLSPDTECIYFSKVKKDDDIAKLKPYVKKVPTGWVDVDTLKEADRKKVLAEGDPENMITEWQDADFDTSEVCASCPLAWNKGRNCLETFGPDNTQLPEIAKKAGCPIVAGVPEAAKSMKKFTPKDAQALLKEVEKLRPALEADSKMAVRRYSGVLDRLESMAKCCSEHDCGFYFF